MPKGRPDWAGLKSIDHIDMLFIACGGATFASVALPPAALSGILAITVVAELDVKAIIAVLVGATVLPGLVGLVIHGHAAIVELHDAPRHAEQCFDVAFGRLPGNDLSDGLPARVGVTGGGMSGAGHERQDGRSDAPDDPSACH